MPTQDSIPNQPSIHHKSTGVARHASNVHSLGTFKRLRSHILQDYQTHQFEPIPKPRQSHLSMKLIELYTWALRVVTGISWRFHHHDGLGCHLSNPSTSRCRCLIVNRGLFFSSLSVQMPFPRLRWMLALPLRQLVSDIPNAWICFSLFPPCTLAGPQSNTFHPSEPAHAHVCLINISRVQCIC